MAAGILSSPPLLAEAFAAAMAASDTDAAVALFVVPSGYVRDDSWIPFEPGRKVLRYEMLDKPKLPIIHEGVEYEYIIPAETQIRFYFAPQPGKPDSLLLQAGRVGNGEYRFTLIHAVGAAKQ